MAFADPAEIELLVLDVDGVMTAGDAVLTDTGQSIYFFNTRDGCGLKYWHRSGGKTAIITGRQSHAVQARAELLGIQFVYQSALKKIDAFRRCLTEAGVEAQRVCYVGDDLPDLPPLPHCGYPVAVADAVPEVKASAVYVTKARGGAGAVREVIERLLRARNKWSAILQAYHDQKL